MGFKDNLVKNKKGGYTLKSKTTKKSKTYCLECGEDGVTRDFYYIVTYVIYPSTTFTTF